MNRRSFVRSVGIFSASAALLISLIGAPSAAAATPDYDRIPLYGGQTTQVGFVDVWNDLDTYFVDIHMASGWCMTESHVIVAKSVSDIPQANGNPIPGKFPYGEKYANCITYDVFSIPIGDLGADPYVAVHVKAWEKVSTAAVIVSNPGSSNPVAVAGTYPDFGTPVDAVESAFSGWPTITGASYISNQAAGDPFNVNMWRRVTETLNVPGWPTGGELWVNSDNYEFTKVNGVEVERDQDAGATVEGTAPEPAGVSPQTWQTIKHVSFDPKMGTNKFEFVYRNSTWSGGSGFTDNPTGLAYKAKICYYAHSETAWADGTGFPGKNWATYYQFHFKPILLRTVTVPATDPAGVSSGVLPAGKSVLFKVTGTTTWLNRGGFDVVDAECVNSNNTGWQQGVTGYPDDLLNLQVAATTVDWVPVGAANANGCANGHQYTFATTGAGGAVNLRIYDGEGNVQNAGWFGDNSGELTVAIYQVAP